MSVAGKDKSTELAALLIAPNRELARQFAAAAGGSGVFRIVADLQKYPPERALESRLRHQRPDVVLVDFSSNPQAAGELTRRMASWRPATPVIGLSEINDSQVILDALRQGASEFLQAPFEASVQRDAAACILRLRAPERDAAAPPGKVLAFASAKPGSGASTLACQVSFALKRVTGQRVLVADLDLAGGTVGFYLGVKHSHSMLDAIEWAEHSDPSSPAALAAQRRGVEILPAPATPYEGSVKPGTLQQVLEKARREYDWVVLDLPSVFHRLSLQAFWEADLAFVVSTAELPSLFLARKAVTLLGQLGLGKDRVQVLLNRAGHRGGMTGSDLKKIIDCPVDARFPEDAAALNLAVTMGEALEGERGLGRVIEGFAGRLAGVASSERRGAGCVWEASPAFSGT